MALVGASERRLPLVRNVLSSHATAFLVNPSRPSILDEKCFPSLSSLPEVPETAVLGVAHNRLLEAAEEAVALGVRALVVPGLGAESGAAGAAVAEQLRAVADRVGTEVLGANCMGVVRPGGAALWIGTLPESLQRGSVAALAQSGSVCEGLVALGGRVGFDTVVSSGSELSRDAADFLSHFASEDSVRSVGLYLETVRRPADFAEALVACAEAGKPVVCVKTGRSAAAGRVALAHTGALVGSARSFSVFLRAHGVLEVEDLTDLVETLEILGRRRWPKGKRVAAVSESGGEAELLADHGEAAGLAFEELEEPLSLALSAEFPNFLRPTNPLDAWAVDSAERVFPRAFALIAASRSVDVLLAQVDLTQFRSASDQRWCAAVVRGLGEALAHDDELFGAVVSSQVNDPPPEIRELARAADLPLLRGIGAASAAVARVASWRPRRPAEKAAAPALSHRRYRAGPLAEMSSGEILEEYGVPVAPRRLARSTADALAAGEELGYPVVVKVHGPAHKTVLGGVARDVLGGADLSEAAERLLPLTGEVLVARRLSGTEIICGALRDAAYGALIAVGAGGALGEEASLSAVALAPLDEESADELIGGLPWLDRLLTHGDRRATRDVLLALSRLVGEHPEIEALDVNPLLLTESGPVAVDALVVVGAAREEPAGTGTPTLPPKEAR